jgi:hypothetical protein
MPIQRNQPSPERQSVLTFVSPSVGDLLFYETVDAKTVGAGSAVAITNATKATQNLDLVSGYHGPEYDGGGTVVGNLVTLTVASHSFVVGDYVTIEDLGASGVEVNGTHKVVETPGSDSFKVFIRAIKSGSGYADVGTLTVSSTTRAYKAHPSYGTPHPDTENFYRHKLCHVKQADPNGLFFQYYYAEREFQDDYNFEFSQSDIGGNKYDTVTRTYVIERADFSDTDDQYQAGDPMPDPTDQFSAEDVIVYDNNSDPDEQLSTKDYILLTRQQKRIGDQELDGLFVVEQRVYFRRVDISTHKLDPATEGVLCTVEKLVCRGETYRAPHGGGENVVGEETAGTVAWEDEAVWGLDRSGINHEAEQISHDWWKVTLQDVIPQDAEAHTTYGANGKKIREYTTYQNFTWPAVVGGLVFTSVNKKDGSSSTSVTVRNKEGKDGFSGPTKMSVLQIWSKDALTPPAPTVFKTTSASYSGVQFSVRVSNVLTEAITLTDFIGTGDPVYKLGDYAFPKPWCTASSPTDWPSPSFIGAATQKPFRGGYLLEVITVFTPS